MDFANKKRKENKNKRNCLVMKGGWNESEKMDEE